MTDEGVLEQRDGRWQLVFVRELTHAPDKVWRAITEPEHLVAWFPFAIQGERAAGAELRFTEHGDADDPGLPGQMISFDPPHALEFRWDADETVRLEVSPAGAGTRLTLINRFDEFGKAARDAAGWHACLDALVHHLVGPSTAFATGQRWGAVHPGYVERFGPAASTIGPPGA